MYEYNAKTQKRKVLPYETKKAKKRQNRILPLLSSVIAMQQIMEFCEIPPQETWNFVKTWQRIPWNFVKFRHDKS